MPHDNVLTAERVTLLRDGIDRACRVGEWVAVEPRELELMLDELTARRSASAALVRMARGTLADFPPGEPDNDCDCGSLEGTNRDCERCEMIREIMSLRGVLRNVIVMANNNRRRQ